MYGGIWGALAIVALQLCLSVHFVCVPVFVFLYEGVRFLPALTEHHGDPAEHFCIIRSLPKVEHEAGPRRQ